MYVLVRTPRATSMCTHKRGTSRPFCRGYIVGLYMYRNSLFVDLPRLSMMVGTIKATCSIRHTVESMDGGPKVYSEMMRGVKISHRTATSTLSDPPAFCSQESHIAARPATQLPRSGGRIVKHPRTPAAGGTVATRPRRWAG